MIKAENLIIKTIIDNTSSKPAMMAEWGLSIYIDTGERRILFDTGAGNPQVLLHNLDVCGISPTDIDTLVLSHGHQDHTGGLRPLFERLHQIAPRKTLEVICHPGAMEPQYVKGIGSFGCPYTQEELIRFGARFHWITEPFAIGESVIASGVVPMENEYESVGMSFFRRKGSCYTPSGRPVEAAELGFDPINEDFVQDTEVLDDMCLILNTDLGPMVILGCAHRGMINSIRLAGKLTKNDRVYMVIGGTHLAGASEHRMRETVQALDAFGVQKVGVSHCTGQVASAHLCQILGRKRFFFNNAGSDIRFTDGELVINEF